MLPPIPSAGERRDPAPFTLDAQGHVLTFLPGGRQRMDALMDLIEGARESLLIAFYIFATDESAVTVRDALARAAGRGVDVRVMVDGFGADADAAFFAPLLSAGGQFCCFQAHWGRRYLIRNHQKIVVADRRIAMLGGFNVEDDYFAGDGQDGWTDLAFMVEGAVVERVDRWAEGLWRWCRNPRGQFKAIRRLVREWDAGDGAVQLLIGGPTRGLSSWARSVSHDLVQGNRLDMMMAYFSPPHRLAHRIRRIARAGQARLILAGRSDNGATVGAARSYYRKLLRARAELREYSARKLHTKLIVLDDAVYAGSANFDLRSLYLNLEIVLRIEDAALATRMREMLAEYWQEARPVTAAELRRVSWFTRARWQASWFLVSLVDYTVSRRLNLGL